MKARGRTLSTALLLLAGLGAGFVLGVLWSRAGGAPRAERLLLESAPETAPEPIAGPVGVLSARPALPERPSEHAASPDAGPAAPATDEEAATAAPEFPGLDVWVESADRTPMGNATVYARLAGAPLLPDSSVPQARADGEGHARLLLPGGGRYDVGAVVPLANQTMEIDVEVPARKEVRLRFPAWDRVRVVLDESVPTLPKESRSVNLQVWSTNRSVGYLPARDQAYVSSNNLSIPVSSREASLYLPIGREFGVTCSLPNVPLVAVPARIQAPGNLRLEFREPTRVRVQLVPAERVFPTAVQVHVDLQFEGLRRPAPVRPAAPGRDAAVAPRRRLDPRRASREGRGCAMVRPRHDAGSATLRAQKDGAGKDELRVSIEVRDPPPPPVEPEDVAPPDVRIYLDLRSQARDAGGNVYVGAESSNGVLGYAIAREEPSATVEVPASSTWVLALVTPDAVAGPVRRRGCGGAEPHGRARRVPRRGPGGHASRGPRDPAARAGRRPAAGGPRRCAASGAVPLEAGMRLGPFEPGEVTFTLTLGGLPAGEVRAVVRAGATLPLRIPPFKPVAGR